MTRIKKTITVRGDDSRENLGLVHVYTGDGKGKTTASLGLAMRALGNGYRVYMIQFLKSGFSGELKTAEIFKDDMNIQQYGVDAIKERLQKERGAKEESTFVFQPDDMEKDAARQGLKIAQEVISSGEYNLVILDEINCALDKGLVTIEEAKSLIDNHEKVELVFTGRDAPEQLFQYADYVSVIQRLKHPWEKGIKARKGIEY